MGVYSIVQEGGRVVAGMKLRVNFYFFNSDQLGIFGVSSYVSGQVADGATAGEVALVNADAIKSGHMALWGPDTTFLGCKVSQRAKPGILPGIATGNDTGLTGALTIPFQLCGMITHKTLLAGVEWRGRSYIPFVPDEFIGGNNTPVPDYVTALQTLADYLAGGYTVVGAGGNSIIDMVVYHKGDGSVTPVAESMARAQFGGQRRRGSYGQSNTRLIA